MSHAETNLEKASKDIAVVLSPREKLELELAIAPQIKYYEDKIKEYVFIGCCEGLVIQFTESIRQLRHLYKKLNP